MNIKKLILLPISLVFSAAGCAGIDQMLHIIWVQHQLIIIQLIILMTSIK